MTEDALKNKISELKLELERRDQEIEHLDDVIEELQDKIMELEDLKKLEDGAIKKSKKIQAAESRFAYEESLTIAFVSLLLLIKMAAAPIEKPKAPISEKPLAFKNFSI